MSEVVVGKDAAAVADNAAELFVESTAGAVAARGRALVALTGGSAAPPLFAALRSERWKGRVPWAQLEFFYTDERAVSIKDALSNHGVAERELLRPLGIDPARVHRLRGEAADLPGEAARAAAELRQVASGSNALLRAGGGPPRFDLILLGLGPDGHICSLFANTDAAAERSDDLLVRSVAAPTAVEPHVARLTLTPAALLPARAIVLMTAGAKKSEVLARALKGAEDLRACPAQWLRRATGRVVVSCDEAAAAGL